MVERQQKGGNGKRGGVLLFLALLAMASIKLALAAFFAFVGFNKATAPLADLATYGSWTVHVPELLGRAIGWSEMACALCLFVPGWRRANRVRDSACFTLIANQLVAAAVHFTHGEAGALPQNGGLVGLLALVAWFGRWLNRKLKQSSEGE